jgi:NADH-quinone oxidoreductase subunit M
LAILASFSIEEKIKPYMALFLALETGMLGVFLSLDLLLFFVFWEVGLVPMYFLIDQWGSKTGERELWNGMKVPSRRYASFKFMIYTMAGSLGLLLAIQMLGVVSGTFDLVALFQSWPNLTGSLFGLSIETVKAIAFWAFAIAFAIKVPVWPFHTWLPDAHTEAPTVGSVLLAAIMLKMGTYGFIRIAFPILPDAAQDFAPLIGILAVIAIIYGALCCFAQTDLKRLIAFSSVGHMGFVMLGLATLTQVGINGAIFGMVAHGLITGMLFFVAGSIHERYHTREIAELGGVLEQIPKFGSVFTYAAIASLGPPGLAGFWGEMLALLGSYNPAPGLNVTLFRVLMVGGGIGTVLTAGYLLWTVQRVNLGRVPEKFAGKPIFDVTAIEWIAWSPLLLLIVVAGLFPKVVLEVTDGAVQGLISVMGG